MATVNISGHDYFSYQTVAEVGIYAGAALGPEAVAWDAADPSTTQPKAVVTATRRLDALAWAGEKTDPTQDGQWPRTGMTYRDGMPVESTTIPAELLQAHSELSMALTADATVGTTAAGAQEVKSERAGSVAIEYFRNLDASAAPLPSAVLDLIQQWLGGDGSDQGSESTGTCAISRFDKGFGLNGAF